MPERTIAFQAKTKIVDYLATSLLLFLIRVYMLFISPLKPQTCRFYPSCSQYAYDAISKYGFVRGSLLSTKRVLSCHPFNPGGYHPVE